MMKFLVSQFLGVFFRMKLFNKNTKIASWIVSPFLMGLILMLVYLIRGIYPFGSLDISYHDMSQNYIAGYTHTYDFYHGTQGLFWDWYLCGGVTTADAFGSFVLNPFNLFFLFVKRNKLLEAMSFFLLIKVCFAAFAMSYYTERKYGNLSKAWKVMFGIIYASCGYTIQYYTNIQFLDSVVIFPLLMFSVDLLIELRRRKWFIVFLILGFLSNTQLMLMICIYIVIYSYFYSKEKGMMRRRVILDLGCSVLVSGILSAIVLLPTVQGTVGMSRVDISSSVFYSNIYDMLRGYFFNQKLFMCYGVECALASVVVFAIKKKSSINRVKTELILVFMLIVPIFIDCINIVWHIVGYMAFPMRFGFMLTFSVLLLFAKILLIFEEERTDKNSSLFSSLFVILLCSVGIAVMWYCIIPLRKYGDVEVSMFARYGIGLIVAILIYGIVFSANYNKKVIIASIICQCVLGWFVLLAPDEDGYQPEMASNFITASYELSDGVVNMLSEDPRLSRVRDDSMSLNTNYPAILNNSAISGWSGGCNGNMRYLTQKMGYGALYTKLVGAGATVFSDSLFHTRKIISYNDSEIACHIVDKVSDYYLKESDIYYPYGILVDDNIVGWSNEEKNVFLYQNAMINVLHKVDSKLFNVYDLADICDTDYYLVEDGLYYNSYIIPVDVDSVLYFKGRKTGSNKLQIGINGEIINVNDLLSPDNTVYPSLFNNGVITLGEFENEMVYCEIVSSEPIAEGEISIAAMDINLLKEKTEEQHKYEREITPTNNGLKYKVNNTDGYPYLLLPIGFQDKFWCKVNGKFVECEPCVEDALTLIPIEEGMNEISLVYIPRGLITGAIISVIGLIALIIMWKRWDAILEIKWLQNVANVCFTLLFWAIIVCIYIIPTIAEVVLRFIWNPFGI